MFSLHTEQFCWLVPNLEMNYKLYHNIVLRKFQKSNNPKIGCAMIRGNIVFDAMDEAVNLVTIQHISEQDDTSWYVCGFKPIVCFLAQRCLCNRSSVNLTFLPNICHAMYPPPPQQRPLVEGGSTSQYRWRVRLQDWLQ